MIYQVAPHAGAWVETVLRCIYRWLCLVAPHAGAWVETCRHPSQALPPAVAPHAGAWVETGDEWKSLGNGTGRAPCGRVG